MSARSQAGRLLLRVEDIDPQRSRSDVAERQRNDLRWLGIDWDLEVAPQSQRDYQSAIRSLASQTYHCVCTRKDWSLHLGFCACRLDTHDAGVVRMRLAPSASTVHDRRWGPQRHDRSQQPDPKLVRRDGVVTYNLAVVADDIRDGVTEVVRGADLLDHTSIQAEIFHALGATPPTWLHTPMLVGRDGKKLSKSHGAQELRNLRDSGVTPAQVWRALLPIVGLPAVDRLQEALEAFTDNEGERGPLRAPFSDI